MKSRKFYDIAFTADVLAAQRENFGRSYVAEPTEEDPLTASETEFIAARDSFYMATVNRDGWPYLQHRGGTRGFLRVLDERTLAFADLSGNRQLISVGNVVGEKRVALFLMDYVGRRRLKILGRARTVEADAALLRAAYGDEAPPEGIERFWVIEVAAYDWNCPKYITQRFAAEDVEESVEAYEDRIAELEAELAAYRDASE